MSGGPLSIVWPHLRQHMVINRQPPAIALIPVIAAVAATAAGLTALQIALVVLIASILTALLQFFLFRPKSKSEDLKRDLRREQSLPIKRFVYGDTRVPGTAAQWRVNGVKLFGPLICNSRPSDGNGFELFMDKRRVELNNREDMLDFTGPGSIPTNAPFGGFLKVWVGLGDQTTAPSEIVAASGGKILSTDAWTGTTVVWLLLTAGPSSSRLQRWPNPTPQVDVRMRWSKVWDPRDETQDVDDPATWKWSANQALCTLDALMRNPIQPYQLADLDIGMWMDAADVADEPVPLAAGGTEPRYEVNGIIGFDVTEIDDMVTPLFESGAADKAVIGGRTGIVAGKFQTPVVTVQDVIGDNVSFETLQPGRDVSNTVFATYTSEEREFESAELPPFSVPGAVLMDGGVPTAQRLDLPMVTSHTQAARIQKIAAYRARAQKRITCELPPTALNLVAGAGVTVDLPAPFDGMNGTYQIEEIVPALIDVDEDGSGGVAMRLNAKMREYSPVWFDWDTSQEPVVLAFDPVTTNVADTSAPASVAATPATVTSGTSTISRVTLTWAPVTTSGVVSYDVEFRLSGGDWQSWQSVDEEVRDGSGDVFSVVEPLVADEVYDFRVRTVRFARTSAWTTISNVTITPPATVLSAPVNGSAVAISSSEIDVSFTTPNEAGVQGINFYAGATSDTGLMTLLSGPIFVGANIAVQVTEDALSPSTQRFYAARTLDGFSQESAFSSVVTATTDP